MSFSKEQLKVVDSVTDALHQTEDPEKRQRLILAGLTTLGVPESFQKRLVEEAASKSESFAKMKAQRDIRGGAGGDTKDFAPEMDRVKVPEWVNLVVNGASLVGVCMIAAKTIANLQRTIKTERFAYYDSFIVKNGLISGLSLLWPVIFDATVGYHRLVAQPELIFGFLWPMVLSIIDLAHLHKHSAPTEKSSSKIESVLSTRSGILVSASFAMGTLMSSLKTKTGTRLIMLSLIAAVSIVIPSPSVSDTSLSKTAIHTIQRFAMTVSISYILVGIIADLSAANLREDPSLPGGTGHIEGGGGGGASRSESKSKDAERRRRFMRATGKNLRDDEYTPHFMSSLIR